MRRGERQSRSVQPCEGDGRQTSMKESARTYVAAVMLLTLAGCASRSTVAGNSASDRSGVVAATASADGTLTGVARMYGGPATSDGRMALNGNPGQGITVTAVRQGTIVASMVTGADGAFRFSLPAGSYVIRGCADMAITVAEGSTIHEDLSCPVP